ncbi:MAG TPA: hypothetical protein DEF88_10665 [Porphyromonadaceae bacterium]|mgnify:CR=1 FL=1|jgi:hypothetical protein|nr:hypothetical protein [Porphyromonadaceae bacterium]HCM21038.1 hypothetical protein [Porphyromonadaceae bacterium]
MKYKHDILFIFPFLFLLFSCGVTNHKISSTEREKTVFQTSSQWKPTIDVRADAAIIYGANDRTNISFAERVKSWRDRGYATHFMTGIAWGEYQDYFTGEWDGKRHLDEGQVTRQGDTIWHGHMVPYIVPSDNFIRYMKEEHIKKVIDAGIDAIYLEEPEFWARAGYSEAFKKEWKNYYGFDWRPQHESPENTFLSNKLKYHLYYKALDECFSFAKEYGKSKGMDVRCYVPTHSLVNYSQWQIVSPEASLASLPSVDGYIAQVWTGTSREPNYYNGVAKERVFETAFLEYGSMESMTAPTGRKMFFLTDPIEDWPRDWGDYKKNYQATFSAQLLYPNIADYEVMPWPERIYEGLYKKPDSEVKERIPKHYSTQMQIMINSLNSMPLSDNEVDGTHGIAVLMSNSLMFQRFPTHEGYEDPQLSNFYGQALPFLKRGVPVKILHIENVSYPETWKGLKVLIMSYSNMKPLSSASHKYIAEWVKSGGTLVYCGKDDDPFQTVREWWNTGDTLYDRPSDQLFQQLSMPSFAPEAEYSYGKGNVVVIRKDPKEFVLEKNNDDRLVTTVKNIFEKKGNPLRFKNYFTLTRGVYEIVSVLDESVNNDPYTLQGVFIDLFDPQLPVLREKVVYPGEQSFLLNLSRVDNSKRPQVLASASRIYNEKVSRNQYSFLTKSPINTTNVMRVLLPVQPKECNISDNSRNKLTDFEWSWDETSKTVLLTFENNPEGIEAEFKW